MDQKNKCTVCGADLERNTCEFDKNEMDAPWVEDLQGIQKGTMSHEEHRIRVARWILHHPQHHEDLARWAHKILKSCIGN